MVVSAIAAFILPFEVFLFAYAVLGPLHYLTEISWLHDRNYFTSSRYDVLVLLGAGLLLLAAQLDSKYNLYLDLDFAVSNRAVYVAFISAIIFVFVKNWQWKILGVLLIILASKLSDNFFIFFSVFLPTLVHVFVFTALFVLYGALKSRSVSGIISFFVMLLCPLALILFQKGYLPVATTDYALMAYKKFEALNEYTLTTFFNQKYKTMDELVSSIYHSSTGILIMRFIAFAYMYHYLNWFSKTEIIRWHQVPKARFIFVIVLWVISLALYAYNYSMGFEWLFFLSFLHVLFEFPLNVVSITGIFKELIAIIQGRQLAKN